MTHRRRFLGGVAGLAGGLLGGLTTFPRGASAADGPRGLTPEVRATLRAYARDTWAAFEDLVLPGGLPADLIRRGAGAGSWTPSPHTSPTDVASYLWSTIAAGSLRLIGAGEADRRLDATLAAVERLERAHGFYFNWYDPATGSRLTTWPFDGGKPLRPFLSTVDNAWLAVALMMVRNTRPALRERAEALLGPMDFGFFYEPYRPSEPVTRAGLLHLGYWTDDRTFANTYGMVNTEPRIASYLGIARGEIPPEHYFRISRSRQPERGPQGQTPRGEYRTYRGVRVFESHYTYRGMRIVPSWGGSMFEALMVPLFVPEDRWAPRSWGVNHPLYVRAQIEHGLDEARYGYWGFSPASKPEGGYRNYGVDALGADPDGYPSSDDAPGRPAVGGVVTPHAAFVALPYAPGATVANLRALAGKFAIYGDHGFLDSVNVASGVVSDSILVLDHGMILLALANVLADEAIRRAFVDAPFEAAIRPLLAPEEFTAGPADGPGEHGTSADGREP